MRPATHWRITNRLGRWWIEGTMPDGTEYQIHCLTFADVQRAFDMEVTA